ncbi:MULTISPECIES: bifunctional UDP-N-acetylglucosamine diphosphorylase/glucosamine-1-phosphate N-acetyltransferase GlmU [unclassified Modestobacter]|uniref:bifunctional UDP-N-acetylglucosamine diphosphorylase/glucosamine-1-phosphate N-acetyltransferase GlmU n=1 Tax=unclassified Modestobacter TaxID=2643866 RepID=UPI0022AA6F84|nr:MULTISPECIES: bifunctional UDP-N-acetylglucosamine diphosphorylase/glucosamine-1-phosphate N-acetyltransferase GlmU [unclassified Modestobacter]MCZ2825186.1 bifunctional UDP-N-acetylglucosamine diphosphorylase/glucosamine-1-phosphate N-acetyltransferase GlmU [Modestobacter sp. VKM Ac-2981]MCZ2853749.1 bifunctional UDP-N-acetylglucosamine diphosphorylase/glucosamine-1-phosphate N-acetyltransferase GlmU [Modestobacter sp. VKM Ac-2982]
MTLQDTAAPEGAVGAVVVLAAGQGTRMRSRTPKVLHPLGGRSLLGHVLAAAAPLRAAQTVVVVGSGREAVAEHLSEVAPGALPVVQEEQLGSGHAAAVALDALAEVTGAVLILNGDAPLLREETLTALVRAHQQAGDVLTVLTAEVADPSGLGRIVRDADGAVRAIVEERDADDAQRAIREVNAGVYVGDAAAVREALTRVGAANDQGEQYLTDVLGLLVADGAPVGGHRAVDPEDTLGCNDQRELAARRRTMNDRVLDDLMRAGVVVVDPLTTWVDVTVEVAAEVVLHPGTQLLGATTVGAGAVVGPDSTLVDTAVGEGASVVRSHVQLAEIGPAATVGPFSYLRPGTRLGRGAKVGAYVETKNVEVGEGSKVPHLSYVGDATIGEHSNIGAATVFVNYDGVAKHRTTVGDHVRIGSDTMLVAPVTVGDGAYTAAGSVITTDVPPGAMAVARARQRNVGGWVARRRPGTPGAEAAAAADDAAAAATDSRTTESADRPPAATDDDQQGRP